MDRFKELALGRQLILVGGVLLIIDSFFAWQKVTFNGIGISASASASAWHGFWGVLMGLLTIAIVGWVAARVYGVELPANLPDGLVTLVLGGLILLFALVKNLSDDYSAWASYVGIVLAGVVAAGAWLNVQASGEALPSVPKSAGAAGSGGSTGSETVDPSPEAPASSDPA
jgi:hypothetical protein